MVRIGDFPSLGPGSIPGIGIYNLCYCHASHDNKRADDRAVKVLVSR